MYERSEYSRRLGAVNRVADYGKHATGVIRVDLMALGLMYENCTNVGRNVGSIFHKHA